MSVVEDKIIESEIQEQMTSDDESVILSMDDLTMPRNIEVEDIDVSAESEENEIVAEAIADPISDEIKSLVEPFAGPVPAGADPRYGDEFIIIKTEIDKTAYNDYNAVMTLAKEILTSEGKDLRVAGYFILSNSYIKGLEGLVDGLYLYRLLVERFGESLYPQRESARLSALQWLNNNKILHYAKQHADELDLEMVGTLEEAITSLNSSIKVLCDDHSATITVLNDWLKTKRKHLEEIQLKSQPANLTRDSDMSSSVGGPPAVGGSTSASGGFTSGGHMSETEMYSMIRGLVNQLLTDSDYQRAISYSRAARWGGMKLPPNENNKTRISPPRQTGVNEAKNLLQSSDYVAAFKASEGAFFEMGGHMLFDIQFISYKAAKGMGDMDLANLIAYETAALLQRFPDLAQLRFDDDTPFAAADVQTWLSEFASSGQSNMISPADQDKELLDVIATAKGMADSKGLKPAIAIIDQYRPKTEKHRFHLRLAMAQLCLEQGKPTLALPLLEELNTIAESTSLAMWDTQLAMSVAKYYQNALKGVLAEASDLNKAHYEKKVEELSAQMCRWDLAYAIQIL